MGSNLVIAAIPDENDPVWKVSSEKIPHLTVLFLGEADAVSHLDQIMLFVEHAAQTSLKRFYLPVDRRGELGDDEADVLFFKKNRYDFKAVRDFRATLLQDQNIRTAYDSAEQFDGPWNPHLTLGYPETPAKPVGDGQISSFYSVDFNKIAVWTGDFEGPDWLLKDYWDDMEEAMDYVPMDVAMSALAHATTVSDKPWSQFKDSDYDDSQYARACLLDRGKDAGTAKERYGIPVREPDGTVNRNACHAAASVLSSTGGTGSARGNKVKGTPEQIAAAKKKLVSLYKSALDEDVPKGLGGDNSLKQTADLGSEFLSHYGKKGMKWGVRNVDRTGRTTEKHREGVQKFLDPQGHDLSSDVAKTGIGVIIPVVAPLTIPAQIRLIRGGARGLKAKSLDNQEKKFEKHANSAKNFVAIHNGAQDQINKHISEVNKKYPQDLTKDPKALKQYDSEVTKGLQDAYRTSANQLGNKTGTRHLDLEFHNDGLDFKIVAKEGMQTPTLQRVVHAATDDSIEFTGKIKRDATGHIVGLEFDDFETKSQAMAQTAELGLEFLEHHGVKGQKWGVRKERFQSNLHARRVSAEMANRAKRPAQAVRAVDTIGTSKRKKSSVSTKGGEDHPPTAEAISVAVQKQKIKKSGLAALSNNDLQEVQRRLNLENDVKRLMEGDKSVGQKFIDGLLGRGSKEDRKQVENQAGQKAQGVAKKAAAPVVKKVGKAALGFM